VLIPAITPGIFSGMFMALTYSLDDFAVTFFVTGNGFSTLSVEIYSRARQGIDLEINALSTVMFIFVLVLVGIYYVITNQNPISVRGVHNEKVIDWNFSYSSSLLGLAGLAHHLDNTGCRRKIRA
jgi:ABC-type Fe3+ transport system permease subunit